jgi:hypothetical protein
MSEHGLLYFAGIEVANQARVLAYMGRSPAVAAPGCSCIVPGAIGDDPYVSVAADPAPWYDAADPVSERFGGVWIERIDGLDESPYVRSVTQRLGDGSVTSRGRRASKTLTVTAWLFAADCCAADFGLRWLTTALYSSCSTCDGDELCFLSCCPQETTIEAGGVEGPDGIVWDTPARTRTLTGASLLSGPTVLARATGCGEPTCAGTRPMYQVQWIMDADPCVWRQPVVVADGTAWPVPTGDEPCNIQWVTDCCDTRRPGCVCTGPCQGDPQCPEPEAPPVPPPAEPDCICIPLQAVRQCVDIDASLVPGWEEASLIIRIDSGSQPMRNLMISVWPNPIGRDPDELSDCQACGRYYVTHIPASSTLTIDGRTCSASVRCPGEVTQDAGNTVYGSAGGPLACVTLSCGLPYTICVDVDAAAVAPDARLWVELVRCEVVA